MSFLLTEPRDAHQPRRRGAGPCAREEPRVDGATDDEQLGPGGGLREPAKLAATEIADANDESRPLELFLHSQDQRLVELLWAMHGEPVVRPATLAATP